MSYRDELERCLEALRNGADLDTVIGAYRRHAARLREDLALAASAAGLADELSARAGGAAPRAREALERQLAVRRAAVQRPAVAPPAQAPRPRLSFFFQGAAAFTALVIVALGFAAGGLPDVRSLFGGTAEAATLEGIVVESGGSMLSLQTADGIESVSLPADVAVTDARGAGLDTSNVEAGQAVTVRGKRLANATFTARRISLDGVEGLQRFCTLHSDRCAEVERRLQPPPGGCEARPASCQRIEAQAEAIRAHLAALGRRDELQRRCHDNDDLVSCRELIAFCRQHADLCRDLAAWLRSLNDRVMELRERLRSLLAACRNGFVADCFVLRQLCDQHPDLCPDGAPLRPVADAAPLRSLPVEPTAAPVLLRPPPVLEPTAMPPTREPTRPATPTRATPTRTPEGPKPTPTTTKPPGDREPLPSPTAVKRDLS